MWWDFFWQNSERSINEKNKITHVFWLWLLTSLWNVRCNGVCNDLSDHFSPILWDYQTRFWTKNGAFCIFFAWPVQSSLAANQWSGSSLMYAKQLSATKCTTATLPKWNELPAMDAARNESATSKPGTLICLAIEGVTGRPRAASLSRGSIQASRNGL